MKNEPDFFPIQSLTFDPELQVRVRINDEQVSQYAECMGSEEEMKVFPPVEIFYDGVRYWLADGHHRRAAAEKAGHSKIWGIVKSGTHDDALWAAIVANGKQGLPLTKEDKKRAVEIVVKKWPDKSLRLIAETVGASPQTIMRIKDQLFQMEQLVLPKTTIGKDGKSRPAKQKPTKKSDTENSKQDSDTTEAKKTDVKKAASAKSGEKAAKKSGGKSKETVTVKLKSSPKVNEQYNCGTNFEPDPDDDYFDWITDEEREELDALRAATPNRVVPHIRNFTIQNIPEHKPDQLLACLFSLFKVQYREKLAYGLLRKMASDDGTELAASIVTTLYNEFQIH